jgi:large subunit ribosomal protein L24e
MVVKTEVCAFSGSRIYPGHGITYVRIDNKSFKFVSCKVKCYFQNRWNPRKLAWTQMYRRLHKKGTLEEQAKKRSRKVAKGGASKSVVGAPLELIKAKRNQKPEVRQAAREAALREVKERQREKQAKKKAAPKPSGGAKMADKPMGKQPKAMSKGGGKGKGLR